MILDWAVLTVSFFITICLFWLGLMVILNGNRRVGGTWLTGAGLLLAGLFFISHTAILGRGLGEVGFGMDFWWWVSWTPAIVAPFVWYAVMLWYTGFHWNQPHPHRLWLRVVCSLAVLVVLMLILANPLVHYSYMSTRFFPQTPSLFGIPLMIVAYLVYSLACYLLPLDLLLRVDLTQPDGHTTSRRRARPWLIGATLSLLGAGIGLTLTALWALGSAKASLSDPVVAATVKQFDLIVASLVGLSITLLGRAIVGYEVFTGRPLPRQGFFRHWRSTVILASGFSALVAWTLVMNLLPIYSLMLTTLLVAFFYALFSWRSFTERETFMTQLRPFVSSQDLYGSLIRGSADPAGVDQRAASRKVFETLCRDVLAVRSARLVPLGTLATLAGPPLMMGNLEISLDRDGAFDQIRERAWINRLYSVPGIGSPVWATPLWNEHELGGVLFLGEKMDGNPFSDEEIDLAQAGGERVLDMLAGGEMARVAVDLMRQRISQTRVVEGRTRRELHDEILPMLHTAILELSGDPEAGEAVQHLADTHRKISNLVRDIPAPLPDRLAQQGFLTAFKDLVENDFQADFKSIGWDFPDGEEPVEKICQNIDPASLEVGFYAARELIRNAGRHAGGIEGACEINLVIRVETRDGLLVSIEDDGCGLSPEGETISTRGGNGLRLHSAMLAAVGGRMEVAGRSGETGVCGRIWLKSDHFYSTPQI